MPGLQAGFPGEGNQGARRLPVELPQLLQVAHAQSRHGRSVCSPRAQDGEGNPRNRTSCPRREDVRSERHERSLAEIIGPAGLPQRAGVCLWTRFVPDRAIEIGATAELPNHLCFSAGWKRRTRDEVRFL